MQRTEVHSMDAWRLAIIAVARGSHTSAERSALARDRERGLVLRLGPRAYVERAAFGLLSPEDQHVVRMRALVAVADAPIVFSHWSAAVLHGLPVLRTRLGAVHATVRRPEDRHRLGLTAHLFPFEEQELVRFHELIATGIGRTVLDLAGAAPFEEGVMAADGSLAAGVPRALLAAAVDLAGPRRAAGRIRDVVAFGHPGAESAVESRWRVTSMRLGVQVPELQYSIRLADGSRAFLDGYLAGSRVGVEVDGESKYLDPRLASDGTGRALVAEKRREDEGRLGLAGLVRPGWVQAGSAPRCARSTSASASALRVHVRRSRTSPALHGWHAHVALRTSRAGAPDR